MRYLCLAYGDRKKVEALTKEDFEALVAKCRVYDEELKKSGHLVSSQSLEWDVMSLRPRGGKTVTMDGPFVETKETVGGLIIIEARDLNEALRVAALHPAAHLGEDLGWGIEVRPIADGCHQ
ncbi:MAG: YciI family protein [Polyangiaceae bacterium]